ncbi:hypothetical protein [Paenibacillus macerans]|nr:hypothetical protein [Paenibacillus macerans]
MNRTIPPRMVHNPEPGYIVEAEGTFCALKTCLMNCPKYDILKKTV